MIFNFPFWGPTLAIPFANASMHMPALAWLRRREVDSCLLKNMGDAAAIRYFFGISISLTP